MVLIVNSRLHELLSTAAEWAVVLDLAMKWGLDHISDMAVKYITHSAPLAERIVLARRYGWADLLLQARMEICGRGEPLSLNEARQLGVEEIIPIIHFRETVRNARARGCALNLDHIRLLQTMYLQSEEHDKGQSE